MLTPERIEGEKRRFVEWAAGEGLCPADFGRIRWDDDGAYWMDKQSNLHYFSHWDTWLARAEIAAGEALCKCGDEILPDDRRCSACQMTEWSEGSEAERGGYDRISG